MQINKETNMSEKPNLFGTLLKKEGFYKASTIVQDLAIQVPPRAPAYSSSPSLAWMSAIGFEAGTMSLWYGPKSSGKTMLVLDLMKDFMRQEPDAIAVFVDAEMSFEFESTLRWMAANGIDLERVLIVREVCIMEIFEQRILKDLQLAIKNEGIKICFMAADSIQAMSVMQIPDTDSQISKAAKDNGLSRGDFGKRANYLAKIFPFVRMFCRTQRIHLALIGQARSGGNDMFGNQIWDTNGGEALQHEIQYKFLATNAGENIFHPTDLDANGKPVKIGHQVKVVCQKNKMGEGDARVGWVQIEYMRGIVNKEIELVDICNKLNIIEGSGAWLSYNGLKFNGSKKMAEALVEDPILYRELFNKMMMRASTNSI
jgi:RecA/RadA recombinase